MDPSLNPDSLRKINSTVSQRLPPPALFQGPPSHNASNLSLHLQGPATVLSGANRPASPRPNLSRSRPSHPPRPLDAPGSLSPFLSRTQSRGEVDGSDALWEEMQSALSDVEVSAAARGHVFGQKHSEALEDLRMKHLRLAQAWARNEAEEEKEDDDDEATESKSPAAPNKKASPAPSAALPAGEKQQQQPPVATGETGEATLRNLDEETEKDILLARERREANDRYFDRVNGGVLDVVAKLEEIAQAMRTMEAESKDIWSDDDSISTATHSTSQSVIHAG